jgi:hypothetical protein
MKKFLNWILKLKLNYILIIENINKIKNRPFIPKCHFKKKKKIIFFLEFILIKKLIIFIKIFNL